MKQFKGTPGEWFVGKMDNLLIWVASKDKTSAPICDIFRGNEIDLQDEDLANAHLIAAAPELLEALISLSDLYRDSVGKDDSGYWFAEDEPVYQQATAAINKALNVTK